MKEHAIFALHAQADRPGSHMPGQQQPAQQQQLWQQMSGQPLKHRQQHRPPGQVSQQPQGNPGLNGMLGRNVGLNVMSPQQRQQRQQILLLQHMREGMGSGPTAIAGGAGMGPGGYAVTQQGYAASDKMRMNQAQVMPTAAMGMPGMPQQQQMNMPGQGQGQDGRAGSQAAASPGMNPQQILQQQQQQQQFVGQQGGMPNPFQLSQMQQRQAATGAPQQPSGGMNPQQFQLPAGAMSMGWNGQASSPVSAGPNGGGWQVGLGGGVGPGPGGMSDPSAGGFAGMTVPGDMGASAAGGGDSMGVDPVSLYTNW